MTQPRTETPRSAKTPTPSSTKAAEAPETATPPARRLRDGAGLEGLRDLS